MKSCDSIDKFLKEHPQVEKFEILLHDLNGVQRGKWLPRSKIKSLFEGKVKMPMSSCSLDCWGRDLEEIVIETGGVPFIWIDFLDFSIFRNSV